jgi:hypothetical protein
MRYTLLISILVSLVLIIWSCSKNKFSSTPSLKFESVNTTQLHQQETLKFTLSFTDLEGDFSDSGSVFVQELVPNCSNSGGFQVYVLPVFPTNKDQKGQINVTLGYNDVPPKCPPQNDTATFRFALKDDANHVSDTISSPTIIIYN